jgi:hypothetical protein
MNDVIESCKYHQHQDDREPDAEAHFLGATSCRIPGTRLAAFEPFWELSELASTLVRDARFTAQSGGGVARTFRAAARSRAAVLGHHGLSEEANKRARRRGLAPAFFAGRLQLSVVSSADEANDSVDDKQLIGPSFPNSCCF